MKKILVCHNGDARLDAMIHIFERTMLVQVAKVQKELERQIMNGDYTHLILPITGVDEGLAVKGSRMQLKDSLLPYLKEMMILTGLVHPTLVERCQEHGVRYESYLTEDFAIANNYMTSEGIIEALVNRSRKAIYKSRVLIVGYGKLGQILAKVLKPLKANITIAARDPKDLVKITIDGHIALTFNELSSQHHTFDFVVTTVPYPVIDESALKQFAESQSLVLDVSSQPYSFDLNRARALQVNAHRLPQIPGRIAPETSGKLLAETIISLIEGGGGSE